MDTDVQRLIVPFLYHPVEPPHNEFVAPLR
jgi:hypothetical protein